jgi:hypothetical protein
MPHFFIISDATTPNPGRWTRERAAEVVHSHHGTLEHLWFDDLSNPQKAYFLVKDGDLDGLSTGLHAHEITTLYDS